jgi:hypothetical protein
MRDGAREESIKWESDVGEWVGEANQRFVVEPPPPPTPAAGCRDHDHNIFMGGCMVSESCGSWKFAQRLS